MPDHERCCKTCALWDREAAQDRAGRVRSDRPAHCLWQFDLNAIPASIRLRDLPHPTYMRAMDGQICGCWKERDDA